MKCYVMLEFLTLTAVSVQSKNRNRNKTAACPTLTSYTDSSPLLLAIRQTAAVINGLWHRC